MRDWIPPLMSWLCVLLAAIAAGTDFRTGKIPNWLTFPPLVVGPFIWLIYGGGRALNTWPLFASFLGSFLSALICGGTLYVGVYRKRISGEHAIGAGDIKLFAALGALGLVSLGIESMFYAVCTGTMFALARLAWRGVLLTTLANASFILLNPLLPKRHQRELSRENLTKMRFGSSIFVGVLIHVLSTRGNRPF
ncbi:MAG: A24 family peptidase [Deltaproteobacteria bacterium]|nr:A24 family peptidase [Deltaproteobacteria bacterium]